MATVTTPLLTKYLKREGLKRVRPILLAGLKITFWIKLLRKNSCVLSSMLKMPCHIEIYGFIRLFPMTKASRLWAALSCATKSRHPKNGGSFSSLCHTYLCILYVSRMQSHQLYNFTQTNSTSTTYLCNFYPLYFYERADLHDYP